METNRDLFKCAMKGDWEEVVRIYIEHPEVRKASITKSGDTALHMAVSDGQEDIVERLVAIIYWATGDPKVAAKTLRVRNERGNTPLHLAATLGSLKMCKCIASIEPKLINARNSDRNTPLFLAVLNGKKNAFLCLDNIWSSAHSEKNYSCCRGKDGETILHSAIIGEYFDLAYQILCRYENLVSYTNEKGVYPLHVLATKPSAFKSGSRLARLDKIIYHCTFVDELQDEKVEKIDVKSHGPESYDKKELGPKFPENYQTCSNIFRLFRTVFSVLFTSHNGCKKDQVDDTESQAKEHQVFLSNYQVWFDAVKLISKAMLIILGCGSRDLRKVQDKKQQHVWTLQILKKILNHSKSFEYENDGQKPQQTGGSGPQLDEHAEDNMDDDYNALTAEITSQACDNNQTTEAGQTKKPTDQDANKRETSILIAAKYGIMEIVEQILELFPMAIHDINSNEKNIVLLAVENRQTRIYQFLLERNIMKDSIFSKVDKDGNSAVHLAAKIGEYRPWLIPGAALQMQWEFKWYEFVKDSMPLHFFVHYNKNNETPKDIFTRSHSELVKQGGEWLTTTSESCSVVAALIATVAFATASTVPGGNSENGKPNLENQPAFDIFAISSLVALCFSVTAMVMFLAILTSRHQERDFRTSLPRKLLMGLTSLFVSITSMLISFCAGHFFVLKDKLKFVAIPVYAVTCLPVTFFAIAQFPLYFDLIWAMFQNVPQRSYRVVAQSEEVAGELKSKQEHSKEATDANKNKQKHSTAIKDGEKQ